MVGGKVAKFCKFTLAPLAIMVLCPPVVILMWYTAVFLGGSLDALWQLFSQNGILSTVVAIWKPIFFGSAIAWKMIAAFIILQLAMMRLLPGKSFENPTTPRGNKPEFKANGMLCYLLTLSLFGIFSYVFPVFSPTLIYDHFGELLSALNILSFVFCLFLYVKGRFFPSSNDAGTTGNFIFDYFWGTELYPKVMGWDIKSFTNCRFGLIGWSLIIISFAAKQKQMQGSLSDSMIVSMALQLIYITKFFIWEKGYMKSIGILHDRTGFYICWGCLVWLPGIYTSPTLYLVNHPNHLGPLVSALIFCGGSICILINYLADRQRELFRETNGQCFVWKKKPHIIIASYITRGGENRESMLLASGWWGIARHFHYLPELFGAFLWSIPALFFNFLPYFYLVFLAILLLNRTFRHDKRCAEKYGKEWDLYCEHVPYKIIPFIY